MVLLQVVLDNGILQATIAKPGGFVTGIRYNGIENILGIQLLEDDRGYWDLVWAPPGTKGTKGKFERIAIFGDMIEQDKVMACVGKFLSTPMQYSIHMEDYSLVEELANFGKKNIPEQVERARGASVTYFLEAMHDISYLTCFNFLQPPSFSEPVPDRFSTVLHEGANIGILQRKLQWEWNVGEKTLMVLDDKWSPSVVDQLSFKSMPGCQALVVSRVTFPTILNLSYERKLLKNIEAVASFWYPTLGQKLVPAPANDTVFAILIKPLG
ncbi:hypothetical protein Nepgr_025670 [Nepenthes gracilis]|uniref:catalase n=1 Tax=Nepenthes gracilis TaxID=150966 RepID=A0AAD3T6W8_NEPGR|nr:hypothetical protein Nepgr_025670 [Nepenthes gracilis]